MTKIQYKSINLPGLFELPLILISDIVNEDSEKLLISICDIDCSYVIVNGKKYGSRSGNAEIDFKALSTGICEVIFVSGTKRIAGSAFFNDNGKIESFFLKITPIINTKKTLKTLKQ